MISPCLVQKSEWPFASSGRERTGELGKRDQYRVGWGMLLVTGLKVIKFFLPFTLLVFV